MKDIIIKSSIVKREIFIILTCLGAAIVLNLFSIFYYGTSIKELFTELHSTIGLAVLLYFIVAIFRLLWVAVLLYVLPLKRKLRDD